MSFFHVKTYSSSADDRVSIWGSGTSSGADTGSQLWTPLAATLEELAMAVQNAPAIATAYNWQAKLGGSLTGPVATIPNPSTSSRTTLGVSVLAGVSGSQAATASMADPSNTGAPASQTIHACLKYVVPSANDIQFINAQDAASNITVAGTNRFFAPEWSNVAGSTATQALAQVPWPTSGQFRYFAAGYSGSSLAGGTTVVVALQIGGLDSLYTTTFVGSGSPQLNVDTSTIVNVNAGDQVNFRYIRTVGVSTAFAIGIVFGFTKVG